MAKLIIDNKTISAPIELILHTITQECGYGYFSDIIDKGTNIQCTCPFHKDGKESHPSCQVYNEFDGDVEYGFFHCFTCGVSLPLYKVVAHCFGEDDEFGKEWLSERFGDISSNYLSVLPYIDVDKKDKIERFIDKSEIDKYKYFHPYQFKRKLTEDVIRKFSIGYNKDKDTIVFPVWDEKDNLVMFTERSVNSKKFYIESNKEKPVYLLNYILKENITNVYVCESQINALTCWSYGYPAIALFGTGSTHQYDILNKSGIRSYTLLFDGDDAGRKGAERFKKRVHKNVIVKDIIVPNGKDVNDLSKDEFEKLLKSSY